MLGASVIGLSFSPGAASAGDAAGASPIPVPRRQVLDRVKIDSGLNPIIYDRVVPPSFSAPAVPPKPDAVPQRGQPAPAEEKQSVVLFLFATVYDHEFTVLRWSWEGREYQAVSNMDFNYLTGLGMIETEDRVFSLLMGLANESREQFQARRQTALQQGWPAEALQRLPSPPPAAVPRPAYWLVSPDPAVPVASGALAGIDALHRYFEANKAALIAAFERWQAEQAARELEAPAAPPPPKETVIQFWPVKSRVYPTNR